jgi:pilus assembly protein FimV
MLTALYRANDGAFDGKNMNRLRAGTVLNVPKGEEASSIPRGDATKEIRVRPPIGADTAIALRAPRLPAKATARGR